MRRLTLVLALLTITGCAGTANSALDASVPVMATALKPHLAAQDSPAARRVRPQAGPTEAPAARAS